MPPAPGMIPRLISGWPKVASSPATSMSQAMASSAPPPRAKPRTAAIVGVETAATRSQPRNPGEAARVSDVCAASSATSAPAAKARVPAPVMTIARHDGSPSSASTASARRRRRAKLRALRARGRFSVTRATPSEELRRLDRRPVGAAPAGRVLDEDEVRRLVRVAWSATSIPRLRTARTLRRRVPVSTPERAWGGTLGVRAAGSGHGRRVGTGRRGARPAAADRARRRRQPIAPIDR